MLARAMAGQLAVELNMELFQMREAMLTANKPLILLKRHSNCVGRKFPSAMIHLENFLLARGTVRPIILPKLISQEQQ